MMTKSKWTILGLCLSFLTVMNCEKQKGLRINGLEPSSGAPGGGGQVTILGNGFEENGAQGGNVYFGDRNAKIVKFVGNSELIVEAPAGEAGAVVDVTVRFDDAREHTYPKAYTYLQERESGAPVNVEASKSE